MKYKTESVRIKEDLCDEFQRVVNKESLNKSELFRKMIYSVLEVYGKSKASKKLIEKYKSDI